jgi:alcohol dehydrogenase class IV
MAVASLFSGLALANAGLGAVHGFAGPAGGMLGAPHGAICAALLPAVIRVNLAALRQRQPDHVALTRYDEVAQRLTGSDAATANDGVRWIEELVADLQISGLSTYGLSDDQVPTLVRQASKASSMKGNPLPLTDAELTEIVQASLESRGL